MIINLSLLFSGIIFWTLLEYIIHRFLGHKKKGKNIIKLEHGRHHAQANYFAPMLKKALLAVVVLLVQTFFNSNINRKFAKCFFLFFWNDSNVPYL